MNSTILKTYRLADDATLADGLNWYADSRRIIRSDARRYKLPVATVAAVYAATSIRMNWQGNVTMARRWLAGDAAGLPAVKSRCYKLMELKPRSRYAAERILIGSAETPPEKIVNFYHNLLGDTNRVTVDGWAMVAAGYAVDFKSALVPKGPKYNRIVEEYREAAAYLNISPSELQAITWIVVRGKAR